MNDGIKMMYEMESIWMTTETKSIHESLQEALVEVSSYRDQQRSIEEYLIENHSMPHGTFIELVANPDKAESLSEEETVVFTNAMFQVTQNEKINPANFVKPKLIKEVNNFVFKSNEISLPLTIPGVIRLNSENYLAAFSYKLLRDLYVNKILIYNINSQRLPKKSVNKRSGKIKIKPDIKNKSVLEIKRMMVEGKYEPSTIIINILVDGNSRINYEDGDLTIFEGSEINLIDGAHRVEAIVQLLEDHPDFEGFMNVDIKHFPLEKAQNHLATTNTVNPFDKTLVKFYGGEKYGQEIAKFLMTLPVLKDRIEIKTALNKKISITNFAILSEAIEDIFEPKDTKDKYDIQDVLKRFYEYLIPSFEEELVKNRIKNLEESWISHHNMHVGFIVIAKKLYDKYGKDFPVDEIVRIINAIDFNKKTSELTEIMGGQGKVNSNKVKGQIKEFIGAKVDKLL